MMHNNYQQQYPTTDYSQQYYQGDGQQQQVATSVGTGVNPYASSFTGVQQQQQQYGNMSGSVAPQVTLPGMPHGGGYYGSEHQVHQFTPYGYPTGGTNTPTSTLPMPSITVPKSPVTGPTLPGDSKKSSSVKRHNPYSFGASQDDLPLAGTSLNSSMAEGNYSYHSDHNTMNNNNSMTSPMPSTGADGFNMSNGMEHGIGSVGGGSHSSVGGYMRGGGGGGGAKNYAPQFVHTDELLTQQGNLVELARSSSGSSFIQAALREGMVDAETNLGIIAAELIPSIGDLLLDAHGCYVIKSVLERLSSAALDNVLAILGDDPQLVYSMCTHSLHTRRVVQFLMDSVDSSFIVEVLIDRCQEVAKTQQGCIVMQKAMDLPPSAWSQRLLEAIYKNLLVFAVDPFANYVIQHLLEVGERAQTSQAVLKAFTGSIVRLSCNKFASNVMEKCLFHVTPEIQHQMIQEMYDVTEEGLHAMLQDSFGNYIIQSSIALATYNDVFFINERLREVLQVTPYGHKIEARLDRRLKGKPVGTRSPQIGANSKTSRRTGGGNSGMQQHHQHHQSSGNNSFASSGTPPQMHTPVTTPAHPMPTSVPHQTSLGAPAAPVVHPNPQQQQQRTSPTPPTVAVAPSNVRGPSCVGSDEVVEEPW